METAWARTPPGRPWGGGCCPSVGGHGLAGAVATRAWKSARVGAPATSAGRGLGMTKLEASERNLTHARIVLWIGSLDLACHMLETRVPSAAKPGKTLPSLLAHSLGHSP